MDRVFPALREFNVNAACVGASAITPTTSKQNDEGYYESGILTSRSALTTEFHETVEEEATLFPGAMWGDRLKDKGWGAVAATKANSENDETKSGADKKDGERKKPKFTEAQRNRARNKIREIIASKNEELLDLPELTRLVAQALIEETQDRGMDLRSIVKEEAASRSKKRREQRGKRRR